MIQPSGALAPPLVARAKAPRATRPLVRTLQPGDFAAVRELQRIAYPTIEAWRDGQLAAQLARFPEGQLVAEVDGRVVGMASSLIVQWDHYAVDHTWKAITADGTFSTHDRAGRTLYGAEVVVDAGCRGNGVGRALYQARASMSRELGLKRIIAAGRIPGYHRLKDVTSPELYAMRVIWGDIQDPVLGFQLSQGFHYCGIIHNYLPEDRDSCGHAALLVRLNSRPNARREASPRLAEAA
jgi:predicted N-acetyltransferase YhbS